MKGNNIRQSVCLIGTNLIEWVNGCAAEAASGIHGETHVAAGIIGGGDLMRAITPRPNSNSRWP